MVSVPADPHRFGPFDARVGHIRRYDPDDLCSRLADAGLAEAAAYRYGYPLGTVLEWGRNLYASGSPGRRSHGHRPHGGLREAAAAARFGAPR